MGQQLLLTLSQKLVGQMPFLMPGRGQRHQLRAPVTVHGAAIKQTGSRISESTMRLAREAESPVTFAT